MSDPQDHVWPDDAACAGHAHPELWDQAIDGEDAHERAARHEVAKGICRDCPVRDECLAAVDPGRDDGVRGGVLLASLHGSRSFGGYGAVQGIVRKRRSA